MAHSKNVIALTLVGILLALPMSALASELTSGDVDDNLQYDYYLDYLARAAANDTHHQLPELNVKDRVILRVLDGSGWPISHARVSVTAEGGTAPLVESYTNTRGMFYFFPAHDGAGECKRFIAAASPPGHNETRGTVTFDISELGPSRQVDLRVEGSVSEPPVSLDLLFCVDVTGSMCDELSFLTREFGSITDDITKGFPNVSIRFGLVVYRDHGDAFVVRSYDFTRSLSTMQSQLNSQEAAGGGDYEEAVDEALAKAVSFPWREGNTVRMLFHVGDAPPHDQQLAAALQQVDKARHLGIQMFPVAGSGVGNVAEYMMRAEGLLTTGRYLFLTDDSGIGNTHEKPHVCAYVVTYLDDLIYRIVASELIGWRVEPTQENVLRTVGPYNNGTCEPGCCGGNTTNATGTGTSGSTGGSTGGDISPASPGSYGASGDGEGGKTGPSLTAGDSSDSLSPPPPPCGDRGASKNAPALSAPAVVATLMLVIGVKMLIRRSRKKN